MILFRCSSCGAVHRVEAQYAGSTMTCGNCGQEIAIPRESDPQCVLVYKAGESEDGFPMHLDDVQTQLVAGELSETDLVWDSTTWRPLGEYMGLISGEEQGDKQKLSLKKRDSDGEEELAESLDDLPPVQQVGVVQQVVSKKTQKKKKEKVKKEKRVWIAGFLSKWRKKSEAKEADKDADKEIGDGEIAVEVVTEKRDRKVYYIIQAVMGVLALVMGYKFGFGPLISKARELPTNVIVQNHEPYEYVASLGWRRIKQELYKEAPCRFEIYVGMPEKQTLTMIPKEAGKGEKFKVKVPLRPGGIVIVNLKRKGEYGVFDPSAVSGEKLAGADLGKLLREVAANQAPQSAVKVSRAVRDLVRPAFKGTKTDLYFLSGQYNLLEGSMFGVAAQAKKKKEEAKKKKEEDKKSDVKPKKKDFVLFPPVRRLSFSGGYSVYDHRQPDKVDRGVYLDVKAIKLNKSRTIKASRVLMEIRGDNNKLTLQSHFPSSVELKGTKFTGEWRYSASSAFTGKNKGRWTWNWRFTGSGHLKGSTYRMNLSVNSAGIETQKVQEVLR